MADNDRYLFHALFADLHFDENEYAVVETPENKVPACTVPNACAEPDEEKTAVFSALSENRDIEQIVAEERAEGNVPPLPEFGYVLTDERVVEVFVKVKSENASETDSDIGVSREVKEDLERVSRYTEPCAYDSCVFDFFRGSCPR